MRTNLEKYNFYYNKLRKQTGDFLKSVCKDLPDKFYELSGWKVRVLPITEKYYSDGFYGLGKPTRKDIEKIKKYLEELPEFKKDNIFIGFRYEEEWLCKGKPRISIISGARKLSDINKNERYSFDYKIIKERASENEKIYAPKEGYKPCRYCGRQRLPKDLKQATIISRSYDNPRSPLRNYCVDRSCASYDQMAHEG